MTSSLFSRPVLVAGAGVSGSSCARVLTELGVRVTVADNNLEALARLEKEYGVATISPEEVSDWSQFGLVVTSPGWSPASPLLTAAHDAQVEVIGDVELAYRLDEAEIYGPKRTWLVVTGTNGKTTTTGMLASIMQQATSRTGKVATAVGNIGVSLFDALAARERVDILVAELSSFQLHWSSTLRPDAGMLLNLAEDHIDWHGSFEHYAQSKAKALRGKVAIIGEDAAVLAQVSRLRESGELADAVYHFTASTPKSGAVGVIEGELVDNGVGAPEATTLTPVEGIEPAGLAGILDAAAAAALARTQGANPEEVAAGLSAYKVAGHRGVKVATKSGVDFIDNSKATNPHAMAAALSGLSRVVLIAGGQLKGADLRPDLSDNIHQLTSIVAFGQDRELVATAAREVSAAKGLDLPVIVVEGEEPEDTMREVVAVAAQHAEEGDTVLLAPAGASLDMYTGMAQRGEMFSAAVHALN